MPNTAQYWLEKTYPFSKIVRGYSERKLRRKFREWEEQGSNLPMPDYGKQQVVIEYLKTYQPKVFVETGTHKGRMTYAVQPFVEEIHTIELDRTYSQIAKKRFRGIPKVHVYQGQSGRVLSDILRHLRSPTLFWLDAHYSGGSTAKGNLDTPILQELDSIFTHPYIDQHCILIDDARCFNGLNDYPTEDFLRTFITTRKNDFSLVRKDDIFRVHRKS